MPARSDEIPGPPARSRRNDAEFERCCREEREAGETVVVARAPSPAPPLTQVQQFRCLECESWIDPRHVEDVPHFAGPTPLSGRFRRLLLIRCEACKATWAVLLEYLATAAEQWAYVCPPQRLGGADELRSDLALRLHESPTVRDALRRHHPALYQVVLAAGGSASPAAPPRPTRERRSFSSGTVGRKS